MKFFLPIVFIALINLFPSVSSLPMYSSGSQAPANANINPLAPATPIYVLGGLYDIQISRTETSHNVVIFMGMTKDTNVPRFLPLCVTGDWMSISVGTLNRAVRGFPGVFSRLSKANGYPITFTTVAKKFCPVLDAAVVTATWVGEKVDELIYDETTGVTRLEDTMLTSLLNFVNDQKIQLPAQDSKSSQHTGADISASAPSGSRTPALPGSATSRKSRIKVAGHPYLQLNTSTGSTSNPASVHRSPAGSAQAPTIHYAPGYASPELPYYSEQGLVGGVVPPPAPGIPGTEEEHDDEVMKFARRVAESGGF